MIPNALTIAGSDSSGGAGIQADLKTFSALGVYGASVVTALTAQNTQGVAAIHDVPAGFVAAQLDAMLGDLSIHAVKIGMAGTADAIAAIAARLGGDFDAPIVVDPVMVATSGDALLGPDAEQALSNALIPLARLITPNAQEAARLLGCPQAEDLETMEAHAGALHARGAHAVLVTGGDMSGTHAVDILVDAEGSLRFTEDRVATGNTHGSGCTLSSAVAANLAHGQSLRQAIEGAKAFVTEALARSGELSVGKGRGPLNHLR
jgi:hydroxymethylpyrimidine/phosphomethylpyrimidine kinase